MAKVDRRDKYALAFRLFMDTGMKQSEIAETVGVTEKTITQWKAKNDWVALKAAHGVTASEIIGAYLRQLQALKDQINTRPQGENFPTTREADIIMKVTKSIKILQRDLTLSDYIACYEQLLSFTVSLKPAMVKDLAAVCREFIQIKVKELNKS